MASFLAIIVLGGLIILCYHSSAPKRSVPDGFISIEDATSLLHGEYRLVFWESQLSLVKNGEMTCVAQWDVNDATSVIECNGTWYINRELIEGIADEDKGTVFLS